MNTNYQAEQFVIKIHYLAEEWRPGDREWNEVKAVVEDAIKVGFVDGLKEALRLMEQDDLDFAPGKILNKIKQLSGDEGTSLDQKPPSDCTCRTDP